MPQGNILVTSGGSVVTYDGVNAITDCRMNPMLAGAINKMYAVSAEDVYVVGNSGSIIRYYGGSWQSIPSVTPLNILDIWGGYNSSTGQTEILALASTKFEAPALMKLLRIQGSNATALPDSGLPLSLSGIWFSPGKAYYIVGDGLYKKSDAADATPWVSFQTGLTTSYTEAIRGSGPNDIFVVGHFATALHFNGASWHNYQDELSIPGVVLHAVAIKGNVVVAVGQSGAKAVVVVGRR